MRQALISVVLISSAAGTAAQELRPLHTSADSGFFTLHAYKGKVFGGTYGGRIYRIAVDEFTLEAEFPDTESVFKIQSLPPDKVLIANLERTIKTSSVFRRDDEAERWIETGVGADYPEQEKTMGLGAGAGLGRLWMGVTPYVAPAVGYVWSSADGLSWRKEPGFPASVPRVFIEFAGRLHTATVFGPGRNGIYAWNGSGWERLYTFPGEVGGSRAAKFGNSLYIAAEWQIYRISPEGAVSCVIEKPSGSFFGDMASVMLEDGNPALFVGWSKGWRASGGGAELWRTKDGATWTLHQVFPESECWAVAALGQGLFVGTRENDGHGRIYHGNLNGRETPSPP